MHSVRLKAEIQIVIEVILDPQWRAWGFCFLENRSLLRGIGNMPSIRHNGFRQYCVLNGVKFKLTAIPFTGVE